MKTIRKSRVSRVESLLREVQILRKVSHPNIIELADVYEDEMNLHLVRSAPAERRLGRGGRGILGGGAIHAVGGAGKMLSSICARSLHAK